MKRIIAAGECMLEFRNSKGGSYQRSFAGDVYNTCVYLKRALGVSVDVSFLTTVGNDRLSEEMITAWHQEAIDTSLVFRSSDALPGLYIIETDATGERQFAYWRETSAARQTMYRLKDAENVVTLPQADIFYFSGITVAILDEPSREILFELISQLRTNGTTIAFDPNYRPALWRSQDEAKQWIEKSYRASDIALPSLDDETDLLGVVEPEAVMDRLLNWGIEEVVVKAGSLGVYGVHNGAQFIAPFAAPMQRVDTTAAGDSFDAIYLAQRLQGDSPEKAAHDAAQTAAFVVGHTGAITPKEDFNVFYAALKESNK